MKSNIYYPVLANYVIGRVKTAASRLRLSLAKQIEQHNTHKKKTNEQHNIFQRLMFFVYSLLNTQINMCDLCINKYEF